MQSLSSCRTIDKNEIRIVGMDGQLEKHNMSRRRQDALRRLQGEMPSVRFLRLRMALAVLIFSIIFAVCAPLMIVVCILLYGFFSGGISFVHEIIATNGQVLEGMWPREVSFLFLVASGMLGMGLAFVSSYWIVIKLRLLSPEQVCDLNARLNKAGIFGLFLRGEKKPTRHEFKN